MAKKTDEKGENEGAGSNQRPDTDTPAPGDIEASGDAIIIADAILDLAGAFREVAAAIRSATTPSEEKDEDPPQDTYLDGSPRRK